jgi:alpha-galactosidase
MGNDLRDIAPQDLSILSNAAVIAVNQDPLGQSAARRWLYYGNGTDGESGGSGMQLWSGNLKGTVHENYNDYVVLLVNGNNNATVMNATLEDIFVDSGPRGHAPQVDMSWEVRDLWAGRMTNETAQAIIDASAVASNTTHSYNATSIFDHRYNATATSYADGLAANNSILLGSVTTTVQPSGTIIANVDRHGAAMFRLRAIPTAVRKRDEL